MKSATQFAGSAMVKVPTGGRKKKLKQRVAISEIIADTRKPLVAATPSTTSRKKKPAVEGFAGSSLKQANVTAAIPASPIANPANENGLRWMVMRRSAQFLYEHGWERSGNNASQAF